MSLTPLSAQAADSSSLLSVLTSPLAFAALGGISISILLLFVLINIMRKNKEQQEILQRQITKREHVINTLIQTGEKYRSLFDLALAGIFRSSIDGSCFYAANQACAALFGYENVEHMLNAGTPQNHYSEEGLRNQLLAALQNQGYLNNISGTLRVLDGTERSIISSVIIYPDKGYIEGTVLDVSELQATTQKLEESHIFLQSIFNALPHPTYFKDKDGYYQLVNTAMCQMHDLTPEDILGKTQTEAFPHEQEKEHLEYDASLLQAAGPSALRYQARINLDPHPIDSVVYKEVVLNSSGEVIGTIGEITDITSRLEQERKITEQRALLRSLLDAIPDLIFLKDIDKKYIGCNKAYCESVGLSEQDILGKNDYDLYSEETAARFGTVADRVFHTQKPIRREDQRPFAGAERPSETIVAPTFSEKGELTGLVGVTRDITERKRMESALREAELRYRTVFYNAAEGLYVTTTLERYKEVNPAMASLYGYDSPEEMLSKVTDITKQLWVNPDDRKKMLRLAEEKGSVHGFEAKARKKNGEQFWVSISMHAARDADGNMLHLQGIVKDITEQKLSEHQLALRASTDALTGLPNRVQFEEKSEHMISRAARDGCQLGVLFIDIDGFKPVNDTFGHDAGDEVLKAIAKRITSAIRTTDIAARLGGDEFVVLLWDIDGDEGVYRPGRQLLEELNSPITHSLGTSRIGASIGVSLYPAHGTTTAELLRSADMAMYQVKRKGKNALRIANKPVSSC